MTIADIMTVLDSGTEVTVIDNDGILALKNTGELWALNQLIIKTITCIDTRHILIITE